MTAEGQSPNAGVPSPDDRPVVVAVTGSECTGKTTLASDLSRHFGAPWIPEYVRTYLDEKLAATGVPVEADDVEPIARGQIALQDRALAARPALLVLDTDLVSTVVYARHYYGACPPWIEQAARDRRADLYLLCEIDVPWLADPYRDRPHLREHMQALFARELETLGARVVTIHGSWDARRATAIAAVSAVSRAPSDGR